VASEAAAFRPAFSHLALLLQIPGVDVTARVEAEKGSPLTARERALVEERVQAARGWLEAYAPDRALVRVRETLPPEAADLSPVQRTYLATLGEVVAGSPTLTSGDAWQDVIFAVASDGGLDSRTAFDALYRAFLGRTNGPRAGWLLASLERTFVIGRLREAAAAAPVGGAA